MGAVLPLLALSLTACGGGGSKAPTAAEALASAKTAIDNSPGVHFNIKSTNFPKGVDGMVAADGDLTHAPAFQGTATAAISGIQASVPVVATGGKVWAKLPLTTNWQIIDPDAYDIPDPAKILDPNGGIDKIVTQVKNTSYTGQVRGGANNTEVLNEYKGQLDADAVTLIATTAAGTFDVAFDINAKGQLETATISGTFFGADKPSATYVATVSNYGESPTITPPTN